jgi:hypothetical protein
MYLQNQTAGLWYQSCTHHIQASLMMDLILILRWGFCLVFQQFEQLCLGFSSLIFKWNTYNKVHKNLTCRLVKFYICSYVGRVIQIYIWNFPILRKTSVYSFQYNSFLPIVHLTSITFSQTSWKWNHTVPYGTNSHVCIPLLQSLQFINAAVHISSLLFLIDL